MQALKMEGGVPSQHIERPEHVALSAKYSDYYGWGNHDALLLESVVDQLFADCTDIFTKKLTPLQQKLIPQVVALKDQMTGQHYRRNLDLLEARYAPIPDFKVGEFDEEVSKIRKNKSSGHFEKFIENRHRWFPSNKDELKHLEVDGLNACMLAEVAQGAIHLGVGAESGQADQRSCVKDCFSLMGINVDLPKDTLFSTNSEMQR
jgi:hypothetical protein